MDPRLWAASAELVTSGVRSQVGNRLRYMNWKHLDHAWERRYRDPLGPHGLALFYVDPGQEPPLRQLRTATRLFLAGPEVEDLPLLVHDFAEAVTRYQNAGADARELADRVEAMSPGARYVGAGVSSLDTPTGTWSQARQQVTDPVNAPGRCYALLTDGTTLLLDRGGHDQFGRFHIRCNREVYELPTRWRFDDSLPMEPDLVAVWDRLAQLNHAIVEGTHR